MKEKQEAPGRLEDVRAFLNTWVIPNDTRVETDLLVSQEAVQHFQQGHFPAVETLSDLQLVRQLRDDLRSMLGEEKNEAVALLNRWLQRLPVHVFLEGSDDLPLIAYRTEEGEQGLCREVLRIVVEAVAQGNWTRIKLCRDCQWAFFDHTKNASKVWCGMLAYGPEGRSCGSIAKVRRWREKQKQQDQQV